MPPNINPQSTETERPEGVSQNTDDRGKHELEDEWACRITAHDREKGVKEKRCFASKDRIIFTANDKRFGVLNGTIWQIEAIKGNVLIVRADSMYRSIIGGIMSTASFFYCGIKNETILKPFIEKLQIYSDEHNKSIYVIDKALGKNTKIEQYEYTEKIIILIPKQKIILLDYGNNATKFEEFVDDFISDLEYLSKRYDYQKKLGRSRSWKECITRIQFANITSKTVEYILEETRIPAQKERIVELLISLLIGSINDIEKVGIDDPETLLDKIKQKIILFDGMQSRFLYEELDKKIIRIQGLAGTGKTELLLHKLSELYLDEKECIMAFTCHNKVLSKEMLVRIPKFFNFMKVDEQIEWETRLLVCSSWGSQSDPFSGLYSYICNKYNLTFHRYAYNFSFDDACKQAISELEKISTFEKCFDYIFIDESQDFSSSFFDLCQMITKKRVYIAGDVFQNVFDTQIKASNDIDYLLNKCYRTDPKTLMVAHSIGMGLYETPIIRWLEDDEWRTCGYSLERKNNTVILKRSPLRRFEDIDSSNVKSIQIKSASLESISEKIIYSSRPVFLATYRRPFNHKE